MVGRKAIKELLIEGYTPKEVYDTMAPNVKPYLRDELEQMIEDVRLKISNTTYTNRKSYLPTKTTINLVKGVHKIA